jgi:DNA-binding IclR family transcriptional regulator
VLELPESPRQHVGELLAGHEFTRFTQATTTDPDVLREELESVRSERTARARNERTQGIASVAAPITTPGDDPVGAITVVGTTDALDESALDRRLLSLVVNASRSVENALAQG